LRYLNSARPYCFWRSGSERASAAVTVILDAAAALLAHCGADVVDPVEIAGADKLEEPEVTALLHEFKDDLNGYLGGLGGEHPMSLAELISFNKQNAASVLTHFGQELFEQAEATGGRGSAEAVQARAVARALAGSGLDGALGAHRLDAVLALSGTPAWLTDYVLGDHYSIGTTSPCAVAGYPAITVCAGFGAGGLPVAIQLVGKPFAEATVFRVADAFEKATPFRDARPSPA